ncbi:MAG: hypothetical protein AAF353_08950 [Pseudomonadota bacterium]
MSHRLFSASFLSLIVQFVYQDLIYLLFQSNAANSIAASIASMGIYLLMAGILAFKPRGLFPA